MTQVNLFIKWKQTHGHRKQWLPKGKEVWGRDKLGGWVQHIHTVI